MIAQAVLFSMCLQCLLDCNNYIFQLIKVYSSCNSAHLDCFSWKNSGFGHLRSLLFLNLKAAKIVKQINPQRHAGVSLLYKWCYDIHILLYFMFLDECMLCVVNFSLFLFPAGISQCPRKAHGLGRKQSKASSVDQCLSGRFGKENNFMKYCNQFFPTFICLCDSYIVIWFKLDKYV